MCVYLTVAWVWRGRWQSAAVGGPELPVPMLDHWQLTKAVLGTGALLLLFSTSLPHTTGVMAIAGLLLVSRRLASHRLLGMVDWHLLVLFAGLFVVTEALASTELAGRLLTSVIGVGLEPDALMVLAPLALPGSNTIGNVPLVMLLLIVWPEFGEEGLYALAVLSTLAGNLLLVGSLANLIVAEQAAQVGVKLGFIDHARCGIPMALSSMALALIWFLWMK